MLWQATEAVLYSNYVNVLLVFVPLGIVAGAVNSNPTTVFVLNFFAIVPLAAILSFATEEISMKLGQTIGGLLNASFGNAIELIVHMEVLHVYAAADRHIGQLCSFEGQSDSNCSI